MENVLYKISLNIGSYKDKDNKSNQGLKITILKYNIVSIKNKYIEIETGDTYSNIRRRIFKDKLDIITHPFKDDVSLINRQVWTDDENKINNLIIKMKKEIEKTINNYELTLNNLKDNYYNKENIIVITSVIDYLN